MAFVDFEGYIPEGIYNLFLTAASAGLIGVAVPVYIQLRKKAH